MVVASTGLRNPEYKDEDARWTDVGAAAAVASVLVLGIKPILKVSAP